MHLELVRPREQCDQGLSCVGASGEPRREGQLRILHENLDGIMKIK